MILLCVVLNEFLGNTFFLISMLCILSSLVFVNVAWEAPGLKLKESWTLMVPIDHESLRRGISCRLTVQYILYVLALIFFAMGFIYSEIVANQLEWNYDYLMAKLHDRDFWVTACK